MLSREYRYPFFEEVPEKKYSTPYFTLRYRRRDKGVLRCAVVVGKKVSKFSNVRNRAKRVFLEKLTENLDDWKVSYDVVFYLKAAILGADEAVVEETFREALGKIGVVK